MRFRGGFTLIEFLVIVAVVGVLASVVLVAFDLLRVRARDDHRVTSLGQIARFISINDTNPASVFWTATTTGALPACVSAYCDIANDINPPLFMGIQASTSIETYFALYTDPAATITDPVCTNTTSAGPCRYSISSINNDAPVGSAGGNPTSQQYQVCAWLEGSVGGSPAGLVHIGSETHGAVVSGCY